MVGEIGCEEGARRKSTVVFDVSGGCVVESRLHERNGRI